jgi:hypothetical protein
VKANIQISKYHPSKRDSDIKMKKRSTAEKIAIFRKLFTGLPHAYGTYDTMSGSARQVKASVTDKVIYNHFMGSQPYGIYLLVKDRTRAIAVDFDSENQQTAVSFVNRAKHYGIFTYIERSKSKGYHVWIFFEEQGVLAKKARLVVHHLLNEIEEPDTEIFPKQDALDTNNPYGNFINAPLFGPLVRQGKTVFVDMMSFTPYPNQWDLLESVHRMTERDLDEIIELDGLSLAPTYPNLNHTSANDNTRYGLPVCARKILRDGASQNQRTSCFRLAVHLKRLGLPYDVAVAALRTWALKNKTQNGKGVIRDSEIVSQASDAYNKSYAGFGCGSEAMGPFCEPSCAIYQWKEKNRGYSGEVGHGQG